MTKSIAGIGIFIVRRLSIVMLTELRNPWLGFGGTSVAADDKSGKAHFLRQSLTVLESPIVAWIIG